MTKKLRIISVLIALALAGITYFQIQWVKTSYQIWQYQFDTNVREALTSAIESNLQDKFYTLSKTYTLPKSPARTTIKVLATDTLDDLKSIMVHIDKSDLIFTEDFEEYDKYLKMTDSLAIVLQDNIKNLDTDLDIKVNAQSIVRMTNSGSLDTTLLRKQVKSKNLKILSQEWLDTLIEEVVETKMEWNGNNYTHFKKSLAEKLEKAKINLPFLLGIFDFEGQQYNYRFPENADSVLLETGYKAPILGMNGAENFATLYFPDQKSYILKKLLPVLSGSLFLFLITIASFALMFHTLFRQKKLSEIKNDFVNNMTHELKTPISTVSLALEALQDFDGLKDQQRTEKYLNIARDENNRLGLLVNKILKMSTYERDDLQLHRETCDIHECISNVCRNFDVQLKNANGVLSRNFTAESHMLDVDRIHFNNVVYNLLDNAIKYADDQPEISISTFNTKNELVIEISDNGHGIPKQYQQKVFDKFFRVPSGNIHKVKGHGLGLSYVKKIVEAHGGTISVDSKPGKGSSFILGFCFS